MSGSKTMIMALMILPILLAPAVLLKGGIEAPPLGAANCYVSR